MSNRITSDWNNRDETVIVDKSVMPDRIVIAGSGKIDEAVRVDVDDLLEAIYEAFPDRRPASPEQALGTLEDPLEAKPKDPEWYSARVVEAGGVYYLKSDHLAWGTDWIDHRGAGYRNWEVELLAGEDGEVRIVVGADN